MLIRQSLADSFLNKLQTPRRTRQRVNARLVKIGRYKEPRRIQALPVAPAAPLAGRGVHTYV